jgi:hypothetical protein
MDGEKEVTNKMYYGALSWKKSIPLPLVWCGRVVESQRIARAGRSRYATPDP